MSAGVAYRDILFYQFNDRHFRGVTAAGTDLYNARITAVAALILRRDFIKQLFGHAFFGNERINQPFVRQSRILGNGNHFFRHGTHLFSAGDGGFNAALLKPRFGIAFVWLAVPAGWLANFLISYVALRKSWPAE